MTRFELERRVQMDNIKKKSEQQRIWGVLPGLFLCLVVILIGIYGANFIGVALIKIGLLSPESKTPISSIFIAIIIGIFIRNTIGVKSVFSPGITFSLKYALRAGIVL